MNGLEQRPPTRTARGCLRDAIIVICVLVALILVVGAAAYFAFVTADRTLQQENLANLTESEVRSDLQELHLSAPDLSGYAYVPSESLDGPRFDQMSIGTIHYGSMKDGRLTATTRTVTCDAKWQNSYVSVVRPLTAEFEFVSATEGWKLSIYTLGDAQATPLRPMNVYDLEGDAIPLLRLYDAALGDAYADAHVALSADLTTEGGTVKAVLSDEVDGQPMECTMSLKVSWSNDHGWEAEVADVSAQPVENAPRTADEQAVSAEPVAEGEATAAEQRLVCHAGDLVSLGGILTQRNGIFVLETVPTEVTMAGRSWVLDRFVVTGPSGRLTESLLDEVTANGYLTVGYALPEAPLSLAVKSLS